MAVLSYHCTSLQLLSSFRVQSYLQVQLHTDYRRLPCLRTIHRRIALREGSFVL